MTRSQNSKETSITQLMSMNNLSIIARFYSKE